MILFYRAGRYGRLDTLNSKIHQLFQILDTDPGWCNNCGIVACNNSAEAGAAAGVHLVCRMGFTMADYRVLAGDKYSLLDRPGTLQPPHSSHEYPDTEVSD